MARWVSKGIGTFQVFISSTCHGFESVQIPLPGLFYNYWQIFLKTVDWEWSVGSECETEPPNGSWCEDIILAS